MSGLHGGPSPDKPLNRLNPTWLMSWGLGASLGRESLPADRWRTLLRFEKTPAAPESYVGYGDWTA